MHGKPEERKFPFLQSKARYKRLYYQSDFSDCIEQPASEISRWVSVTMALKHKLEKQIDLIEMELAADT
jgi:hypothetical protein